MLLSRQLAQPYMEGADIATNLAEWDNDGNLINDVYPTERITLAAAVAKANHERLTVRGAQKAGRKRVAVEELPASRSPSRAKI